MSRRKNDKPGEATTDKRPALPRPEEPSSTVIVADDDDPSFLKTAGMPAWPADGAPLTTQPTPAWEPPATNPSPRTAPAPGVTEPTPAWDEAAGTPTNAVLPPVASAPPTNAVLPPVEATRLKVAAVEADDGLRKAATRRTERPRKDGLPRALKLTLVSVGTLSLVVLLWLFNRSDTVADPSRPVPLSALPIVAPQKPPEPVRKVDVTPTIAAPKEPPRPPLSMELVLDAGAGEVERKTVPASIVRIETEPTTTVSWNGEDFGWQPALITMPVGQNVITVENKELGLKKTLTITAAETDRTFLRFEFAKGWLSVDKPKTARVSVAGVPVTQRAVLLWEGRHRVDVVFSNGQKASKTVDVVRGETAELFFDDPLPQE